MTKLMVILSIAAATNLGCKSHKAAPGKAGSGATGSDALGETGGAGASGAEPTTPADPARAAAAAAAAEIGKLASSARGANVGRAIDATVEATRNLSRVAWDPAAIVAAVGTDRTALFAWVRDKTALVPYRGSLRGAVGVVMDRVGNSLDRALLLADLLSRAGLEIRLATAPLEPDAVAKIAASWSSRARPPLPEATLYDEAAITRLVADLGVDSAAFTTATGKLDAAGAQLTARVRTRIADQAQAVAKLVPAAALPPPVDPAVFADHWWVQVHDGEAWTDLDPTLPDAGPGDAFAAATETVMPDELADDRRHTLVVRMIGEVWHGQAREETTLNEFELAPSKFYGQRIVVTNVPLDLPEQDTLLAAKDPPAAVRAALIAQTEWLPVIQVGDRPVVKTTVTDGGEVYDISTADANTLRLGRAVQRATKNGVGGATGLLDTLPGDTGESAPQPAIADHDGFTAEWLEVELRAPGSAPRVVRRLVFDALGATGGDRSAAAPPKLSDAARLERTLALGSTTELLPMFARIPDAFVVDRTVKALVDAKPVLAELAAQRGKPVSKELRVRLAELKPVPGALYALALARFAWSSVGDQVYLDRLDLLAEHRRTVIAGAKTRWRIGFDILANDVAVWPGAGVDARASRLAQGVADTAAEAFVVNCPGGPIACARAINTSDEFAASSKPWNVIAPGGSADATGLPVAARALAAADLAAGYAVVVPPTGVPTWWRVEPSTGETLGMGLGGGDAFTEQVILAIVVAGLSDVACAFASGGSTEQYIECSVAVGFGGLAGIASIEYEKARLLTWACQLIAGLIGLHMAMD